MTAQAYNFWIKSNLLTGIVGAGYRAISVAGYLPTGAKLDIILVFNSAAGRKPTIVTLKNDPSELQLIASVGKVENGDARTIAEPSIQTT